MLRARRLLLLCALCGCTSVFAAEPIRVRIALSEVMAPADNKESGGVTGLMTELLKALFAKAPGYRAELHSYPWTRSQWLVEHGEMDMFVTFPSAARKQYASFSAHPLFSIDYGYLVYNVKNPRAARIRSARSFADLKGLVFISQAGVAWESENIPSHIQRYTLNRPSALMHMAFQRKAGDFFIMPPEQAIYFARQLGYGDRLAMQKVDFIPNSIVEHHIGVRKSFSNARQLLATLDALLQSPAFIAERRAIERKYQKLTVAGEP